MRLERIAELRKIARAHEKTHKSAKIILECLDDIVETQRLYNLAIDSAFGSFKTKAIARRKLLDLIKE